MTHPPTEPGPFVELYRDARADLVVGHFGSDDHLYVVDANSGPLQLCVQFQNGPIGEVGVNGVQVEHLLPILIDRLARLNVGKHRNEQTSEAIGHLQSAAAALHHRRAVRERRGVEGTSAP